MFWVYGRAQLGRSRSGGDGQSSKTCKQPALRNFFSFADTHHLPLSLESVSSNTLFLSLPYHCALWESSLIDCRRLDKECASIPNSTPCETETRWKLWKLRFWYQHSNLGRMYSNKSCSYWLVFGRWYTLWVIMSSRSTWHFFIKLSDLLTVFCSSIPNSTGF